MLQALLIFAVAVLTLLRFAAPGLTFEDSGELAAAAAVWGVPHPPGYPLLSLVGGAFVRVGAWFGLDPARSMVLLSVVSLSGAIALVARFVERASQVLGADAAGEEPGRVAGVVPLAVAGLLLLSPTFRAQGLVVEAYALAAFCNAGLLLAALCWRPAFVGLWFGLAVAAHPSGVFAFPLLAFGLLRAGGGPAIARGLAGVALASATWLYVPLAAAAKPAVNWGGIDGVGGLMDHLLRRQFGTTPERDLAAQAGFVAEHLIGQWPLVLGLALVVGGVLTPRRTEQQPAPKSALGPALGLVGVTLLVMTLGLFWAQHWPVTEELSRVRLAGSFTPLPLFTAAGVGLLLVRGLERGAPLVARLPQAVLLLAVVLLGMVHVSAEGRPTLADFQDMSEVTEAETYARELLRTPAPGDATVLVVNRLGYSDVLYFPLLYGQVVWGLGEGLLVIDRELLGAAWYRDELAAARPDLAPALDELGAAVAAAPADPRSRRLAQVPFLRWLAGRPGGSAYVGRPGPRLVEGLHLSADALAWRVTAAPLASPATPPSRPWLERDREHDVWRAELLREAEERDAFRAAAP